MYQTWWILILINKDFFSLFFDTNHPTDNVYMDIFPFASPDYVYSCLR